MLASIGVTRLRPPARRFQPRMELPGVSPGPRLLVCLLERGDVCLASHHESKLVQPLQKRQATVIVDCLSLWVANLLESDVAVEGAAVVAARVAATRPGQTIAVSNEVGLGLVPMNGLGRRYRDLLGRTNAIWATSAERAFLIVAGRAVALMPAEDLLDG